MKSGKLKLGIILTSRVFQTKFPLNLFRNEKWKFLPIFNGVTTGLSFISCHESALLSGHNPHPPHAHREEEIFIVLYGSIKLTLSNNSTTDNNQYFHLKEGQSVYFPSYFAHTFLATSEESANYLVFKWRAGLKNKNNILNFTCFDLFNDRKLLNTKKKFYTNLIFEGLTGHLQKLHCHTSALYSGAGHSIHGNSCDIAIIVIEGEIEALDQLVKPYSIIFYAAGEQHKIFNPGKTIARYLVFEFHTYHKILINRIFDIITHGLIRIAKRTHLKRKLKGLFYAFKSLS